MALPTERLLREPDASKALSSCLWNTKGKTFRFCVRVRGWPDDIWSSMWCSDSHWGPRHVFARIGKEGCLRRVWTVFKEKSKSSKAEKCPWASDTQEPQKDNSGVNRGGGADLVGKHSVRLVEASGLERSLATMSAVRGLLGALWDQVGLGRSRTGLD